jgi:hypothetical protein
MILEFRRKELLHSSSPICEIPGAKRTGPHLLIRGHIRENSREESRSIIPFRFSKIEESRGLTSGFMTKSEIPLSERVVVIVCWSRG